MALFEVCPNVIAVDGPDGVGKSTFCQVLKEEVDKTSKAAVVRVNAFNESRRASKIGEMLGRAASFAKPNSVLHNRFFLLATRLNYQDTVMRLSNEGVTVILDSSELRALAFINFQGAKEAYLDTIDWFSQGKLTYNLSPEQRIILLASPEDLLSNLDYRSKKDHGDPKDLESVKRLIDCYMEAIMLSKSLQEDSRQKTTTILNPSSTNVIRQLREIAQQFARDRINT